MNAKPFGLARGRHVEISTKSGGAISGIFQRITDDGIIQLRFDYYKEEGAEPVSVTANVSLEDVDTLIYGPGDIKGKTEDLDA